MDFGCAVTVFVAKPPRRLPRAYESGVSLRFTGPTRNTAKWDYFGVELKPVCECLFWVSSRHFTSVFSTGCYAIQTSPSFSILATVSERPQAVSSQTTCRADEQSPRRSASGIEPHCYTRYPASARHLETELPRSRGCCARSSRARPYDRSRT